jgi:FdhD protein
MKDPSAQIRGCTEVAAERFEGTHSRAVAEMLAVEEPLEIRLAYGDPVAREERSISVTMRTPGNDAELAAGFLLTEGVIRDAEDIVSIRPAGIAGGQSVCVEVTPQTQIGMATLQRNFYTTSSCGICGKASLLALQTVRPPRAKNEFDMEAQLLYRLPEQLRRVQGIFERTGGLHAAGLFDADGNLDSMREDVGRHNAVDKLLGAAFLADRIPLRDRMLLLSGRASFELLQKALMGGIPMVASVGAPSSLAVQVAKEFDITLVGFLRDNHFNIYHGAEHIHAGPDHSLHVSDGNGFRSA